MHTLKIDVHIQSIIAYAGLNLMDGGPNLGPRHCAGAGQRRGININIGTVVYEIECLPNSSERTLGCVI